MCLMYAYHPRSHMLPPVRCRYGVGVIVELKRGAPVIGRGRPTHVVCSSVSLFGAVVALDLKFLRALVAYAPAQSVFLS